MHESVEVSADDTGEDSGSEDVTTIARHKHVWQPTGTTSRLTGTTDLDDEPYSGIGHTKLLLCQHNITDYMYFNS